MMYLPLHSVTMLVRIQHILIGGAGPAGDPRTPPLIPLSRWGWKISGGGADVGAFDNTVTRNPASHK